MSVQPTSPIRRSLVSSLRFRLAAAALPVALVLAGCGADTPQEGMPTTQGVTSSDATTGPAADSPTLDGIEVSGEKGAKPTITLPSAPFTVADPGHRVIDEGTGTQLTEDHSVTANFLLMNGKDGKELQSSFGQQVVGLSLADETLQPAIKAALLGQKVGARVLVAVPAREAVGEQGNPQLGVAPEDTLLYFFEVTGAKTPLTEATGTPVPPEAGLPTVTMGQTPQDPVTFTMPSGEPPTQTVVQPLIVGEGPKVQAGQTVRVSYTGVTWRDPANPFDYSGKTPQGYAEFRVGAGQLIKAWDENIPGQTVGSRLLLVVPPADGYGAQGQGEQIKGDDTLVFVLDILDAS